MFFSIVIPTYNRVHLVTLTIDTLLKQTFQDFEIIVVDDGSTDSTEQAIKDINSEKITYYKTENYGVAHARNYGIKKAQGKYVGFLDSDDKVFSNHLQTAFEHLNQNPTTEILHLNFVWMKENGAVIRTNKLPKKLPNDIFKGCSLHVNCIFILNKIAKQNLFNESKELMFAEDWDFFMKLVVRFPVKLINMPTACLIDHSGRSMRNFDLSTSEKRKEALIQSLSSDPIIGTKYAHKIKAVEANTNSLIALNSILSGNKTMGVKTFFKSVSQNPEGIFTRRTLAIIKHLLKSSK